MKWPQKGSKVFKSDSDWWNNACVDYYRTEEKLSLYAEGYKEAGDIITKYVTDNRFFQDILIYPIVFLYRHYIELVLKDIIYNGRKLLAETPEIPTYHDIIQLWHQTKKILKQIESTNNSKDFYAIEEILKQFSIHDPKSITFRYPTDKDGSDNINNLARVNIRNLSEVVDGLHSYFFGAQSVIGKELDFKNQQDY